MTARPEITIIFLFLLKATMFAAPFLLRRHLFWSLVSGPRKRCPDEFLYTICGGQPKDAKELG